MSPDGLGLDRVPERHVFGITHFNVLASGLTSPLLFNTCTK